jgi:hypothetical protein
MSYKVSPDGNIECDTADEALELQAKIVNRARPSSPILRPAPGAPEATEDGVVLGGLGRRFLKLVLDQPGITADDAAERLETTTASFPPMHRGIRAWASKHYVEPDKLFLTLVGAQGGRVYQIDPQYRGIVEAAVRE